MRNLLRYIVIIVLILVLSPFTFAQTQFSATISKMENSLFGMEYSSQADTKRVERIEEAVYGSKSSGDLKTRLDKLSSDIAAEMLGQEIKPKEDTFAEDDTTYYPPTPKADPSVNYPIIDELENNVFKKTNKSLNVEQRLSNLEKKVFRKTYNDDLNSRTERLKAIIIPDNSLANKNSDNEDSYSDDRFDSVDLSDLYKKSGSNMADETSFADDPYSPQKLSDRNQMNTDSDSVADSSYSSDINIMAPLSQLEKRILKHNYNSDEVSTRLVRLEVKLFNSTFTQDDPQTRIDRISSAYQASKSSKKYDNNKFSQHMATAMQVGAFLLMILAVIL